MLNNYFSAEGFLKNLAVFQRDKWIIVGVDGDELFAVGANGFPLEGRLEKGVQLFVTEVVRKASDQNGSANGTVGFKVAEDGDTASAVADENCLRVWRADGLGQKRNPRRLPWMVGVGHRKGDDRKARLLQLFFQPRAPGSGGRRPWMRKTRGGIRLVGGKAYIVWVSGTASGY